MAETNRCIINGKNYPICPDTIKLSAPANNLAVEFKKELESGATYLFRVDGIDTNWISSNYPVMRWQTFESGNYLFHYQARIGERIITNHNFVIYKEAAFWNTWWFWPMILAYFLILIGVGIYIFLLYEFRQKLKVQFLRNQLAADLHDEVGSNLNSIAIFVEVLRKKATPDILPILDKIIRNSRESVELMQDTVWAINPKNDSVNKLFDKMYSYASQALAAKNIPLVFETHSEFNKIEFTMEQRKNLYLIFKESVNNILKHAAASKVEMKVSKESSGFSLKISDDGIGFDHHANFTGNGLYNLKQRAIDAEMSLNISSQMGLGTTVELLFDP